jgi:hypothetical protein
MADKMGRVFARIPERGRPGFVGFLPGQSPGRNRNSGDEKD